MAEKTDTKKSTVKKGISLAKAKDFFSRNYKKLRLKLKKDKTFDERLEEMFVNNKDLIEDVIAQYEKEAKELEDKGIDNLTDEEKLELQKKKDFLQKHENLRNEYEQHLITTEEEKEEKSKDKKDEKIKNCVERIDLLIAEKNECYEGLNKLFKEVILEEKDVKKFKKEYKLFMNINKSINELLQDYNAVKSLYAKEYPDADLDDIFTIEKYEEQFKSKDEVKKEFENIYETLQTCSLSYEDKTALLTYQEDILKNYLEDPKDFDEIKKQVRADYQQKNPTKSTQTPDSPAPTPSNPTPGASGNDAASSTAGSSDSNQGADVGTSGSNGAPSPSTPTSPSARTLQSEDNVEGLEDARNEYKKIILEINNLVEELQQLMASQDYNQLPSTIEGLEESINKEKQIKEVENRIFEYKMKLGDLKHNFFMEKDYLLSIDSELEKLQINIAQGNDELESFMELHNKNIKDAYDMIKYLVDQMNNNPKYKEENENKIKTYLIYITDVEYSRIRRRLVIERQKNNEFDIYKYMSENVEKYKSPFDIGLAPQLSQGVTTGTQPTPGSPIPTGTQPIPGTTIPAGTIATTPENYEFSKKAFKILVSTFYKENTTELSTLIVKKQLVEMGLMSEDNLKEDIKDASITKTELDINIELAKQKFNEIPEAEMNAIIKETYLETTLENTSKIINEFVPKLKPFKKMADQYKIFDEKAANLVKLANENKFAEYEDGRKELEQSITKFVEENKEKYGLSYTADFNKEMCISLKSDKLNALLMTYNIEPKFELSTMDEKVRKGVSHKVKVNQLNFRKTPKTSKSKAKVVTLNEVKVTVLHNKIRIELANQKKSELESLKYKIDILVKHKKQEQAQSIGGATEGTKYVSTIENLENLESATLQITDETGKLDSATTDLLTDKVKADLENNGFKL